MVLKGYPPVARRERRALPRNQRGAPGNPPGRFEVLHLEPEPDETCAPDDPASVRGVPTLYFRDASRSIASGRDSRAGSGSRRARRRGRSSGGIGRRRRLNSQITACSAPAERPLRGRQSAGIEVRRQEYRPSMFLRAERDRERCARRNVASILDSARELGIRDAQVLVGDVPAGLNGSARQLGRVGVDLDTLDVGRVDFRERLLPTRSSRVYKGYRSGTFKMEIPSTRVLVRAIRLANLYLTTGGVMPCC